MARIRLNSENRNKIGTRMRVHIEQEHTQEREAFDKQIEERLEHGFMSYGDFWCMRSEAAAPLL